MIIPDVNVLVHAYNSAVPIHTRARLWWEESLNTPTEIGLPWASALGFIRITTHPRFALNPLPVAVATAHVRSWLARPRVRILTPGERHAELLLHLLETVGAGGNLTTDAHLAALAIEYHAEVVSTDTDFARFPGLRWRNLR
jgi:toxin-antitoxin system PIN domain toxin